MKAIIVTQEEPFYIPMFLSKVLRELNEATAVIILPGIPKGFTRLSYSKRLFEVFGLKAFLQYGALFVQHKLLDFLSRLREPSRSYSVEFACRRNPMPVYKLKRLNDPESLNFVKSLKPEIIISVASPQIFHKAMISLPRYAINVHASLLPEYRGMMPSFWVLTNEEAKTGVTVHHINEDIDSGNIILQRNIEISPEETLHSLQSKVANVGAIALLEALQRIERGDGIGTAPREGGSYYTFPTREAAKRFRARGRRFI